MKRMSALALLLAMSQWSCVMVGGYSSEGGWWIWPGSLIGLALLVIVILYLIKRRR